MYMQMPSGLQQGVSQKHRDERVTLSCLRQACQCTAGRSLNRIMTCYDWMKDEAERMRGRQTALLDVSSHSFHLDKCPVKIEDRPQMACGLTGSQSVW